MTLTYWLADYFFQLLNDKEKPAETEEQLKKVEHNKKSSPKSKVRKIFFPGILLSFVALFSVKSPYLHHHCKIQ